MFFPASRTTRWPLARMKTALPVALSTERRRTPHFAAMYAKAVSRAPSLKLMLLPVSLILSPVGSVYAGHGTAVKA